MIKVGWGLDDEVLMPHPQQPHAVMPSSNSIIPRKIFVYGGICQDTLRMEICFVVDNDSLRPEALQTRPVTSCRSSIIHEGFIVFGGRRLVTSEMHSAVSSMTTVPEFLLSKGDYFDRVHK